MVVSLLFNFKKLCFKNKNLKNDKFSLIKLVENPFCMFVLSRKDQNKNIYFLDKNCNILFLTPKIFIYLNSRIQKDVL